MMILKRRYELEIAHHLTAGVPPDHKCRRVHGHRCILTVGYEGPILENGMIIEYGGLDLILGQMLRLVDHHDLNTLNQRTSGPLADAVSENPTTEHLCAWFVHALRVGESGTGGPLMRLVYCRVEEDSNASVEWTA